MPDSAAVKAWRDKWKMNLNAGWRHDIDATIRTEDDLKLWVYVLSNWGYWSKGKWVKFNPLAVNHQLSEFERLKRKSENGSALAYVERVET